MDGDDVISQTVVSAFCGSVPMGKFRVLQDSVTTSFVLHQSRLQFHTALLSKPLRFVPPGKKDELLSLPVLRLNAVAHSLLPQGGNHWCFYLSAPDDQLVSIDTIPSHTVPSVTNPGGSKANTIVSQPQATAVFGSEASQVVQLDVAAGITVRDFIDLLVDQRRHQYEFNAAGQGCRFWTGHQIDLFWGCGLLMHANQIAGAKDAMLVEYPSGKQYSLVVGAYYWAITPCFPDFCLGSWLGSTCLVSFETLISCGSSSPARYILCMQYIPSSERAQGYATSRKPD